jgi:predicted ester cyclase
VECQTKAIFRRFYEHAWYAGDLAGVDELLGPHFVNHSLPGGVPGSQRELYKQAIIESQRVFPEFQVVIEDLIAEGDKVAARWRATCCVAGQRITDTGMTIVRIVDGKIADFWKQDDALGVLRQ